MKPPSAPAKPAVWSLPTPPPSLSELSTLAAAPPSPLPRTNSSNTRVIRDYAAHSPSNFAGVIPSARTISCLSLTKVKTSLVAAIRQMGNTGVGTWLGLYLICSLALTLHNKCLLDHFPFPWTLTAIHAFSAALGSWVCAWRGLFKPVPLSHPTTPLLAIFSVLYSANIVASNASLRLVSIATHQVVRAVTPLFVLLFAWLGMRRVSVSSAKLKSLTLVILGVVLATYGDYTYTRAGLVLTLLGAVLAALKTMLASWVVRAPRTPLPSLLSAEASPEHSTSGFLPVHSSPKSLPHYSRAHIRHSSLKRNEEGRVDEGYLSGDERHGESLKAIPIGTQSGPGSAALHPLDVLFRLSPLACAQCLIVAWGSGEMARWSELDVSPSLGWRVLGPKLALNGALAFVLNYVSFMASRRAGALSMTVAANVKQVLTVLLALLVFDPHTPSVAHALGIGLTLAGGVWYGCVEVGEKREREEKVDV
ncbi:UAA transporter [Ceratobasidium sp. 394]|nr:UAA transporter [Ceratobasidium sp. 394]